MIYKYIVATAFLIFFLGQNLTYSQKVMKSNRIKKSKKGTLCFDDQTKTFFKQNKEYRKDLRYTFGAKTRTAKKLKSNQGKNVEINDSAYVYDWDESSMDWVLYGRLYYYLTEDSTEILQDKYNQELKTFLKYKKIQSGYDIDGYVEQDFVWDNESSEWLTSYYDNYDKNDMNTEYYEKTWNDTIQQFTDGFRFVYAYENDTILVEELGQVWESVEMKWKNESHMKYTNNGEGFRTNSIYKRWNKETGDWQNVEGISYQFDEFNNLTRFTIQQWDTLTAKWVNESLYEAVYDGTGLYIENEKMSIWNNEQNSWEYSKQYSYEYNDMFLNEKTSIQIWDNISNQWADSLKISIEYNTNGYQTKYFEQLWKGDTWVNSYRDIYTLNEYNEIVQVDSDIYNESKGEWTGYAREMNEINGFGDLDKQTIEYYNPETKEWETGEYYSFFDNKEIEYSLIWDDEHFYFVEGKRSETLLDDNYYPIEVVLQVWDTKNENWVNSQKTSYYLHSLSGIDENDNLLSKKLQIYPNPNNGSFTIQNLLKDNVHFSYSIINSVGKLIYSEDNIRTGEDIYISLQLSQGIYFLQMQAGNNSIVQKFIVK